MPSEETTATTTGLQGEVARWIAAGIITAEQGERIVRMGPSTTLGSATKHPTRHFTVVAELVSYVGIVLVVASGAMFVARVWTSIGVSGRVGVGVVVALVGFVGERAVSRIGDEGTTRLGRFLWLCGTGGVAMSTAVIVDRAAGHDPHWTLFVTGLVVLIVSAALWRNLERPLQFLTSVAGLVLSFVGAIVLMGWRPNDLVAGLLIWASAAGLGTLSLKVLHPSLIATLVAQGGVFVGAMVMTGPSRSLALALGLSAAAVGVWYGLSSKQTPVLVLGVITFFSFVVRLLSFYLRGPGTLLAAFAIGVVLVGGVMWRSMRSHGGNSLGGGSQHRGFGARLHH